jgi:hypothetical protein
LESLPWPTETNIQADCEEKGPKEIPLAMKYSDQSKDWGATGFQICTCIVMTARHAIDYNNWHEIKVGFDAPDATEEGNGYKFNTRRYATSLCRTK